MKRKPKMHDEDLFDLDNVYNDDERYTLSEEEYSAQIEL